MSRPLLIFVGSPNVGPYINVMSNSVGKYGVDRIVLVNVEDAPSGQQVDFEEFVNRELWDTLSDLADGKYKGQQFQVPQDFHSYKELKRVFGKEHALDKVKYKC